MRVSNVQSRYRFVSQPKFTFQHSKLVPFCGAIFVGLFVCEIRDLCHDEYRTELYFPKNFRPSPVLCSPFPIVICASFYFVTNSAIDSLKKKLKKSGTKNIFPKNPSANNSQRDAKRQNVFTRK